ncbi:hypothetical protein CDAR_390311 [Caerostris darwini]|uniref:Uncharacterized protein n=1 Tax=Caerostris darwini TaxID=1538125 RepID=A0AAV4P1G4_9ARAC|nr:hypothetical protein CDAR_390311 [Caerostris darwini]
MEVSRLPPRFGCFLQKLIENCAQVMRTDSCRNLKVNARSTPANPKTKRVRSMPNHRTPNAAKVGHDDGDRERDHQHAAQRAHTADDLARWRRGNHVAVPASIQAPPLLFVSLPSA